MEGPRSRLPTTLALTSGTAAAWIAATNSPVQMVRDSAVFIARLRSERPGVVVVCVPPASAAAIEAVAIERRRRHDLRAVLLDRPADAEERVLALRAGFDEALDTRIDPNELATRIELLAEDVRRSATGGRIHLGRSVWLDPGLGALIVDGRPTHLRPREVALLVMLAHEPGRPYSRRQLLESVTDPGPTGDLRTVDVHITWLREKLARAGDRAPALTAVRGVGYRLDLATSTRSTLTNR